MNKYMYNFNDESLQRQFENFLSTISPDVFDVEMSPIPYQVVKEVLEPSSVEAIINANFIDSQVTYVTTKNLYNKKGEVIYSREMSHSNIVLSTEFFYALRKKYPTISWAMIRGRINQFKKIPQILDEANNDYSYNIVYYSLLPTLNS